MFIIRIITDCDCSIREYRPRSKFFYAADIILYSGNLNIWFTLRIMYYISYKKVAFVLAARS